MAHCKWPGTAALLHGNLKITAGSASAAPRNSGSHLAADSTNEALLYDDQPWAADSASAAGGHGDYDTVAVPASAAALLYGRPESSHDAAGVDCFVFDDSQSSPDSWDDVVHQDVIPADTLDALAPYPIRVSAANRGT